MRRAQMSELMRSDSFQSGPRSSTTTFLPARVRTAANAAPAAPAPTMTASTFSFAMSPAPLGPDVSHIRHAEPREALHRAVGHVDRVVAQREIDVRLRRALPDVDLALAQRVDEIALLGFVQFRIGPLRSDQRRAVDRRERGAIEIDVGWPRHAHADRQQRLFGRHRELAVDEMRHAMLARADRERLADRFERARFLRLE